MIFLSWSKSLSLNLAKRTADLLVDVFETDSIFWISTEGIDQGADISRSIEDGLQKCNGAILFLTIDNINNPWINYEAGAIACKSGNSRIWPFAFNLRMSEFSYSPIASKQAMGLNKEDVVRLLQSIYEFEQKNIDIPKDKVDQNIALHLEKYLQDCEKIISSYTVHNLSSTLEDVKPLICRQLSTECVEGSSYLFKRGFETHEFYSFVLSNAKQRLWVFGRKNKKLFDSTHRSQLEQLFSKIKNDGLDLKILFFDQRAEQKLIDMQQKKTHFLSALQTSISDAMDLFDENGLDFYNYCKTYNTIRNEAIVIMDNFVFFTPVKYSVDGKPEHLTGKPFFALEIGNGIAEHYLQIFMDVYDQSTSLKEE